MKVFARVLTGTALAASLFSLVTHSTPAFANNEVRHVLLLSIDGFHAVDLENCIAKGICPNLKNLSEHGLTYTNASATKPSDSFPGLLAQFTGGTSKSTGVYYDASYDRKLWAPLCAGPKGAPVVYDESVSFDKTAIDGGKSGSLASPNAGVAISPAHLPGHKVGSNCNAVWPHNFIRTNTVFGVLHGHGMLTAWSDKHPAYDIVNGNKPASQPTTGPGTNVDDFFAPEINSDLTPANVALVDAQLGPKFSTAPAPTSFPLGDDFTKTIEAVQWYDGIKVRATLNQINGLDHTGKSAPGTPALFGMNFQAVSRRAETQMLRLYRPNCDAEQGPRQFDRLRRRLHRPDDRRHQQEGHRRSDSHHHQRQTWPIADRSYEALYA